MGEIISMLFPGTILRLATLDDVAKIDILDKKKPDVNRITPRRVIEDRVTNQICLILEQGESIIAYAMFLEDEERCEVAKLVSLDNGLPLLQRAVEETVRWLKSKNIKKLVSRCRKELVPLYKRFGFKDAGVLPHFFGFNTHAIAIELIL